MRDMTAQMYQTITNQAQATMIQALAMTAHSNRDVAPRPHQQVTAIASHLRDSTWMNPPTFYVSKLDEEGQEFLDEVYKVLYAMGVT